MCAVGWALRKGRSVVQAGQGGVDTRVGERARLRIAVVAGDGVECGQASWVLEKTADGASEG